MADGGVAEVPGRRILVVAPQPFYEDRGTPIAVRQVLQALGELGRSVDLLTFPIGNDIGVPGLSILRSANPFGFQRVPIGLSLRKVILDVPLVWALRRIVDPARYSCIHAVEEAAFPAAVLARRHKIDADGVLTRLGIAVRYYDPRAGADIAGLLADRLTQGTFRGQVCRLHVVDEGVVAVVGRIVHGLMVPCLARSGAGRPSRSPRRSPPIA